MATDADIARYARAINKAREAGDNVAVLEMETELDGIKQQYMADERKRYDPANEQTGVDAALIGVGETFQKMYNGAAHLYGRVMGDDEMVSRIENNAKQDEQALASLREQYGGAMTGGNILPYLATAPLSAGATAGQVALTAAVNAVPAMLEYKGDGVNWLDGGIDAAITALPFGAGRVVRSLSGNDSRLLRKAAELGYRLTPGELFNSDTLKKLEGSMESSPFFGGGIADVKGNRQGIANRVALDAVGDTSGATRFTDNQLAAAYDEAGGAIGELVSQRQAPFVLDDEFINHLVNVDQVARRGFFGGGEQTSQLIDTIVNLGDQVDGQSVQRLRSDLGRRISAAKRSDAAAPEYVDALEEILSGLDSMIERQIGDAGTETWETARRHYTAAKRLEKARAISPEGDVSAAKLYQSLRSQDPTGMGRNLNQSDLYDVARLSQVFKQLPDSGTASRSAIPLFLTAAANNPGQALGSLLGGNMLSHLYANPNGGRGRLAQAGVRGLLDEESFNEE